MVRPGRTRGLICGDGVHRAWVGLGSDRSLLGAASGLRRLRLETVARSRTGCVFLDYRRG